MIDTPYFKLDGLDFQTPGEHIETVINTKAAMSVLESVARNRQPSSDPMEALRYLEDTYPRLEPLCDGFRIALGLHEFADEDHRLRRAIRAYNTLADALSGRPRARG